MDAKLSAVVAKMSCQVLSTSDHGHFRSHKVELAAVYGKEGENKDFSTATPSGACWMNISEGTPAKDFFKPGKKYYVTFTEAPE